MVADRFHPAVFDHDVEVSTLDVEDLARRVIGGDDTVGTHLLDEVGIGGQGVDVGALVAPVSAGHEPAFGGHPFQLVPFPVQPGTGFVRGDRGRGPFGAGGDHRLDHIDREGVDGGGRVEVVGGAAIGEGVDDLEVSGLGECGDIARLHRQTQPVREPIRTPGHPDRMLGAEPRHDRGHQGTDLLDLGGCPPLSVLAGGQHLGRVGALELPPRHVERRGKELGTEVHAVAGGHRGSLPITGVSVAHQHHFRTIRQVTDTRTPCARTCFR